jgi:hypothetical protein
LEEKAYLNDHQANPSYWLVLRVLLMVVGVEEEEIYKLKGTHL